MFNPTATLQLPWHSVLALHRAAPPARTPPYPSKGLLPQPSPAQSLWESLGVQGWFLCTPEAITPQQHRTSPLHAQGLRGDTGTAWDPGQGRDCPSAGGGCWIQKPGRHLQHPLTASSHLKKLRTELGGDASKHKRLSTGAGQTLPPGWVGWEALRAQLNSKGIKASQGTEFPSHLSVPEAAKQWLR